MRRTARDVAARPDVGANAADSDGADGPKVGGIGRPSSSSRTLHSSGTISLINPISSPVMSLMMI